MSQPALVFGVAAIWLLIGLVIWTVLGRRGHDGTSWFLIGTLLGPLGLLLAIDAIQHDESSGPVLDVPGGSGAGTIDVLVGADGSPEAHAAVAAATELLGPRLGRVTFVRVIPFDGGLDADRRAVAETTSDARRFAALEPGVEVLRGHPASVLAAEARLGGYSLVVLGTRGHGRHLYGSTARELASSCTVPVLITSGPPEEPAFGADRDDAKVRQ
jgi:nucleotide-binding universal stress UspA family protein